mgnify:CR=1 FL=1
MRDRGSRGPAGERGVLLQRACDRRTNAPPSELASVHFQMPFDSDSLGDVTDPSRLPVWDDQPRVMVNARTVKTIDSMQEHADSLLRSEQIAEGKARAARNRQSGAPEEGSSSAADVMPPLRRVTRVAVRGIRQAQQPNAGRIGRRTGFESVELDAKRTSIVVYHA